jgi:hypothetical protein
MAFFIVTAVNISNLRQNSLHIGFHSPEIKIIQAGIVPVFIFTSQNVMLHWYSDSQNCIVSLSFLMAASETLRLLTGNKTQNHWISELCPLSGIPYNYKTAFRKLDVFSS